MIKKIAACIREYRRDTFLTPLLVAVEVLLEVLIPLVMAALIDRGIEAGDQGVVLRLGAVLAGMALVSLAFGAWAGRTAARASAGLAHNLRRDIYANVQTFSFSSLDKYASSGIVTRLTTDVTNVQNAFQMLIRVAVRCPLMLVFAFAMTVRISPAIAPVYLCVIPILAVGLCLIIHRVHPLFEQVLGTYDNLNTVVQENLLGIRAVKSFVRENHEKEKFGGVSQALYRGYTRAEKLIALNAPLMQICVYACLLLISWLGAKLVVGGALSTGELTSLFNYTFQILMSLMMLSMVLVMVIMARASGARIVEILSECSDLQSGANPLTTVADGSVDFENLSFSYAGDPAHPSLSGVNLHIASGETVGILGGTGAAKTTLVQLIPRLYDATTGVVRVGGRDVKDYDLDTLRDQVAMVLQQNTLFSGTIRENLRWGDAQADDDTLVRACALAQADGFIQELPDGYDTVLEQGGSNVSGGQKQRLCIARALLKQPKILILDDSTSAVDTHTDALIRKAFREALPHTTKLIIAQRVASLQDADHILVLDGGGVDAYGTHEELLEQSAIYREIYFAQIGGSKHA